MFEIATIILFGIWKYYWHITEQIADREKPKNSTSKKSLLRKHFTTFAGFGLLLQFIGVRILPMPESVATQILGVVIVLVGVIIGISARKSLGTNWNHAYEYQVKKNHELITNGIYKYVRHPIYLGLLLSLVGAELVAKSYLFIPFLVIGLYLAVLQGKQEEKILLNHFGDEYKKYMKTSRMLLPFLL
ncbi:isoprenylcysteine carboxylmethyltransferase family protein [Candidatus Woesebacteria bacterium]|nr:isoprenylcysteine carboxylmethyltransferase family protein [Candidatus Woesebacteria bacterium]